MYDTLACHPAGLGNVSSNHFIDLLIVLTSANAKYCYQFTPVPFNNPIPIVKLTDYAIANKLTPFISMQTITALLTKRSAK